MILTTAIIDSPLAQQNTELSCGLNGDNILRFVGFVPFVKEVSAIMNALGVESGRRIPGL